MKTKTLTLLLSTTLLLTACGGQVPASTPDASTEVSAKESITPETTTDLSQLDALSSVEVEKKLFDVKLTIPKDYVGESTQEDLNKLCDEKGFHSITLNEDGSATYIMTKTQHKDLMAEYHAQINDSLQEMIGSENYPNITDIEANENFTEFTITTKSTELSFSESFSVMAFYMYSGLYSVFNGTKVDNVSVTFINADSGKVITTANSSDME